MNGMFDDLLTTGFEFTSSMKLNPNFNFDKTIVSFVDDSNRIDTCNFPE
jgi:hypothetical protein